jgi:hypothetical protein
MDLVKQIRMPSRRTRRSLSTIRNRSNLALAQERTSGVRRHIRRARRTCLEGRREPGEARSKGADGGARRGVKGVQQSLDLGLPLQHTGVR